MRLQARLLSLILPLVCVPLIGLGAIAYHMLQRNALEMAQVQIDTLLNQSKLHVQERFNIAQANIRLFSNSDVIRKYLLAEEYERYEFLQPILLRLFRDYSQGFPEYREIRILLPDGTEDVRYSSDNHPHDEQALAQLWPSIQRSGAEEFSRLELDPDSKQPVLLVFKQLKFAKIPEKQDEPRLLAYMLLTVKLDFMQAMIDDVGQSTQLLFTDNQGNLLFGPKNHPFKQPIRLLPDGQEGFSLNQGQQHFVAAHQQIGSDIQVIALLDADELNRTAQRLTNLVSLILLSVILITSALTFWFIRRSVISPINKLHRMAIQIGQGHFTHSAEPLFGHDELGELAQSLRQMDGHLKDRSQQITQLAYFDHLTGLPNLLAFKQNLQQSMDRAERQQSFMALLLVDLDNFKRINDGLGHVLGDELLKHTAERLKQSLRKSDLLGKSLADTDADLELLGRFGGDEFTILLTDMKHSQDASVVAQRILSSLSSAFQLEQREIFLTGSIGISVYPEDGKDINSLLKHADIAMYQAKDQGRNTFRYFDTSMNLQLSQRLELETDIRKGLEHNQFKLFYQPKVCLQTGRLTGFEALIRWQHPIKGFIGPNVFIPVAEESGLIREMGSWVITQACQQIERWTKAGHLNFQISINLSAIQLNYGDPIGEIKAALEQYDINPKQLEVEITESALMQNEKGAIALLNELHDLGISIALDDFGTGYSSLSYLRRLPIDVLKVDRSFVKEMAPHNDCFAIVKAICTLASELSLKVVAEGAETKDQLQLVRDCGCDWVQGFYYSPAVPEAKAEVFLTLSQMTPATKN